MKYRMFIVMLAIVLITVFFSSCAAPVAQPEAKTSSESSTQTPVTQASTPQPTVETAAPSSSSPSPSAQKAPEGVAQVYIQRNTTGADNGFEKLIAMMAESGEPFYHTADTPNGLLDADDIVLLEFNCQWPERGGTNTDVIYSVAKAVAAHPDGFTGEIVIADNGQGEGTLAHNNPNSQDRRQTTENVVERLKSEGIQATGYLWDDIRNNAVAEYSDGNEEDGYVVYDEVSNPTGILVSYPKFTTDYNTKISFKNGIWDGESYDNERLKMINMPVLKSHSTYMATAAIKKYMGVPSQSLSSKGSPHQSVGLGGMGALIAETRAPDLNVMDMIYIGSRGGPRVSYDEATEYNALGASTDPFAIDYWTVQNILIPAAEEVGNPNVEMMSPDSDVPGSFGYWMHLSLDEANKAGYDFTMDEAKILVHEG